MSAFKETKSTDYKPAPAMQGQLSMAAMFPPAPETKTKLGEYRILASTAGVRVSPLCFGAMSLGDQWTPWMGKATTLEQSFELLDEFVAMGGNFIDTANNYQNEQSEMILGEWMKARNNRTQIILATKYTSPYLVRNDAKFPGIAVNHVGNHKLSLKHSVEDSLRKLGTDYIDILYVHWWDWTTDIVELMQSLNDLVRSGKVMYLGISDTPAWIVSAANEYARAHNMAQFVVYQGLWNLAQRDIERDIIPMARKYGMALAPWGALGQGKFKTAAQLKAASSFRGNQPPTEAELKASAALEEVANEIGNGASLTGVAMAYTRASFAYCFPIVGGASIEHLRQNARDLDINLTPAQVAKLQAACSYHVGFPTGVFGQDPHYTPDGRSQSLFLNTVGAIQFVTGP